MYAAASRLDVAFLRGLARVDDRSEPIAETYRRSREVAASLGIPRPSYERVRVVLHEIRRQQDRRRLRRDMLIDVALYLKPVDALSRLD